jgi:hypothetical protein
MAMQRPPASAGGLFVLVHLTLGFYLYTILFMDKTIGERISQKFRIADRIWIATALLHQKHPSRDDFSKDEIRDSLAAEGLGQGVERDSVNNHLDQHCVANVRPSTGRYRLLYETTQGNLRLYRPSDEREVDPGRRSQLRSSLKPRRGERSVPYRAEIPSKYHPLLDWYEDWSRKAPLPPTLNFDDDPLLRLRGSGRAIWADEHADEYVENLRREDW